MSGPIPCEIVTFHSAPVEIKIKDWENIKCLTFGLKGLPGGCLPLVHGGV